MRTSTKLLGVYMPLATAVVLVALLSAERISQIGPLPDLLSMVIELAVRSVFALAVFASAAIAMDWMGLNLDNTRMYELWDKAREGTPEGAAARKLVALQALAWLLVLALTIWLYRGLY